MYRNVLIGIVFIGLSAGCGEDVPPPAPAPVDTEAAAAEEPVQQAQEGQSTELLREVFSFRGSGRDPFQSLVRRGGEVRPFLDDLRVTAITFDSRFPTRSVAILRDRSDNARYTVRADDQLGRMRVTEIRQSEVVFTIEDFGVPRQVVLSMRRPGTQGGVR